MEKILYTYGHSVHHFGYFLSLLSKNTISAVCDVRSTPYSRRHPQYNKEILSKSLKDEGIAYIFLGKELGAKHPDPECIVNGKVQFELIASRPEFTIGLQRIVEGMINYNVALLCAEEDPLTCHRTILVCRHLRNQLDSILHIRGDGSIETNETFEQRLVNVVGLEEDLFHTMTNIIEDAYTLQGQRISLRAPVDPTTINKSIS